MNGYAPTASELRSIKDLARGLRQWRLKKMTGSFATVSVRIRPQMRRSWQQSTSLRRSRAFKNFALHKKGMNADDECPTMLRSVRGCRNHVGHRAAQRAPSSILSVDSPIPAHGRQ
jgi:hypothetical protein